MSAAQAEDGAGLDTKLGLADGCEDGGEAGRRDMDGPHAGQKSQASVLCGTGHWNKASRGSCWDLQSRHGHGTLAPSWGWQWTLPRGMSESQLLKPLWEEPGRVGPET